MSVLVTFISNAADLDIDYSLGRSPGNNINIQEMNILPEAQNSSISLILLADQFPERMEYFQVILEVNTTIIEPPTSTFASATFSILDNDCE